MDASVGVHTVPCHTLDILNAVLRDLNKRLVKVDVEILGQWDELCRP